MMCRALPNVSRWPEQGSKIGRRSYRLFTCRHPWHVRGSKPKTEGKGKAKSQNTSTAACPHSEPGASALSPRTLCSLTGEPTSWAQWRNKGKSAALGPLHFCVLRTRTRTHTELTNRKHYRCMWAQWRRLCVCARVRACAWSSMWIWRDVGPSEEVVCFHVIFTLPLSLFLFSSSSPVIVADQLKNHNQSDWNIDLHVSCVHPNVFQSSSSLLIHPFVRETLALLPHLICLSFPFQRWVWL